MIISQDTVFQVNHAWSILLSVLSRGLPWRIQHIINPLPDQSKLPKWHTRSQMSCPLPNNTGMNSHYRFAALQDAPPVASYPNFWSRRNYNRIYLKMGFDPLDCSHIPMFFLKKSLNEFSDNGSTSFNVHQCLGANTITNLMIIGDHWWSSMIIRFLIVFGDHQWSLKFENIPWTAFRS